MTKVRWVTKKRKTIFDENSSFVSTVATPITLTEEDKKRIRAREDLESFLESLRRRGVIEERIEILERIGAFANIAVFDVQKAILVELQKLVNIVKN